MIVASLLLILVAVTLLVLGLTGGSSSLLISSIVASLLAAIALVIGARQAAGARRGRTDTVPPDVEPGLSDPRWADPGRSETDFGGFDDDTRLHPHESDQYESDSPRSDAHEGALSGSGPVAAAADEQQRRPRRGVTDDIPPGGEAFAADSASSAGFDDAHTQEWIDPRADADPEWVASGHPARPGDPDLDLDLGDSDWDTAEQQYATQQFSTDQLAAEQYATQQFPAPQSAPAAFPAQDRPAQDVPAQDRAAAEPDYDLASSAINSARSANPDENAWRRDPSRAGSATTATSAGAEPTTGGVPAASGPPSGTGIGDDFGEPDADDPDDEPLPQSVTPSDAVRVARLDAEVLVVDGRPRYHLADCPHLVGRQTEPIPVNEAVELGFTPCGLCRPVDRLVAAQSRR